MRYAFANERISFYVCPAYDTIVCLYFIRYRKPTTNKTKRSNSIHIIKENHVIIHLQHKRYYHSNTSQNNNATLPGIEDELQRLVVTNDNNNDVGSSFQRLLSMISSLQYLDDDDSTSNRMNHYSIIPIELQNIYDTIHQQTTTIYNTVTKYTLMQQMVVPNNNTTTTDDTNTIMTPITNELLQSCCILVACMMTIHNRIIIIMILVVPKSVFRHTKTAILNLLHAVIQLVDSFSTTTTITTTSTSHIDPAQRTGVVWEACQTIIGEVGNQNQKRKEMMISTLPLGNRNAIRRDLLNFKLECQDTIQEFELLISKVPLIFPQHIPRILIIMQRRNKTNDMMIVLMMMMMTTE